MSDVAMAHDYVEEIGGTGKGAAIIARTFALLSRLFPHRDDPAEQWTHRRVRSFWEGDAALVKFREMVELHRAAEIAKSEQLLIEEARKKHAEFIAKTASITAFLERQGAAFHRPQIEALGDVLVGMDRSRVAGDDQ